MQWVSQMIVNDLCIMLASLKNIKISTVKTQTLFLIYTDMFFTVLLKSPLVFLHWYHHITVCIVRMD